MLSIIIPARNEADNLGDILDYFKTNLSKTEFELILVNDFSDDETLIKAKKIFEELERNGIIYSDAYLAAEKVNNDFNNIDEWWNKDQIQKSRIKFCKEFAWNDKDYLNYWKNYLWKL